MVRKGCGASNEKIQSDDDFMMEDAEEDFDFDYEDDDQSGEEADVGLENKYYSAKGTFPRLCKDSPLPSEKGR